ncbi:MAG: S4 domain-containing protein [Bacteroidales bacterium]|jgi:ribosome-associated heat shock protein Hsp15|nr:S4 domain-containing protein [Bacteroidales bacterium]
MLKQDSIRIDKWLWAVRVFKTRSMATSACNKNQVSIDSVHVKPSRTIKKGEVILVKKPPIVRSYKVLDILSQRKSAKVVHDFVEEITPQEEIDKLRTFHMQKIGFREKGLGRPTKKDRRSLDDFGLL